MIDLKEVSKNYGEKKVVTEVCLPIEEEKLTAFIGPNGAGKSTLLSMISRLISIDAGQIYLDHNEVKAWRSNELSKKLSILKQSNGVNLRITVRELVMYGRAPHQGSLFARTTKEDKENHGFGLITINNIISKYNGNIDYSIHDQYLIADITILNVL